MSYFLDDDASQVRELKDRLEKLQSNFLSSQFSVSQENVESGQSIFPGANPSSRPAAGTGGGGGTPGSASEPYSTTLQTPSSSSGVLTINLNFHTHTTVVTENITSIVFSNLPAAGQSREFTIRFDHDNVGGTFSVQFPASAGSNLFSLSSGQSARYVLHTEDQGVSYEIQTLIGATFSGSGGNPLTTDLDYASFDGINIDRVLFDKALGSTLTATDTGVTSNVSGGLDFNLSGLLGQYNFIMNADGVIRLQVNNTSVVSQSLLPVDATAVTGDALGASGSEWARLSVTDVVLKSGLNASKVIFDGDAATPKTYFTGSTVTGLTNYFSEVGGVATAVIEFASGHMQFVDGYDLLMSTGGQIRAGGAGFGMEHIGELSFTNNLSTPAGNGVFYFDGTDMKVKTGSVVKNLSDIGSAPSLALDDLTDVTISSPAAQHVLKYNGSQFVNVLMNLGELGDVIITAPATNSVLKWNGTNWIDSLIQDGDLPSTVVHSDLVTNFTNQQTFAGAGTSIVVTNQANFNGNVNLGNSSLDTITINGKVDSDIVVDDGKTVKATSGNTIGYLVNSDSGSVGSLGTMTIPVSTTGISNASVADSRAGTFDGAMIIQDLGTGSPVLFIRQTDGNWSSVLMGRDALT